MDEKNEDGSFSIVTNTQLLNDYTQNLLNILKVLDLPHDDTAAYEKDGSVVPKRSGKAGYVLGAYLSNGNFTNIPNVERIGWLLMRFDNIRRGLITENFESTCNQLLFAIGEYSNIQLISNEGNIMFNSTKGATQGKIRRGKRGRERVLKLATEKRSKNPKLSNRELAEIISTETEYKESYIQKKILNRWYG